MQRRPTFLHVQRVPAGVLQLQAALGGHDGRRGAVGQPRYGGGKLATQRQRDCQARISSSGSCQVNVARTFDAYLSGSGSVVVSGHPQVTSHTSGSGRVRLAQ